MSENGRAGMQTMFPFMRYQDAPGAIAWLGKAFGFEQLMVVPGPEGTIAHAELRLGAGVVMLGSTKRVDDLGVRSPRELGGATSQGVYVCLDGIDQHYERAREAGAEIVYPLRDTEYGSREYGARDPEGHLWSFGTYRPKLAGASSA